MSIIFYVNILNSSDSSFVSANLFKKFNAPIPNASFYSSFSSISLIPVLAIFGSKPNKFKSVFISTNYCILNMSISESYKPIKNSSLSLVNLVYYIPSYIFSIIYFLKKESTFNIK